MSSTYLSPSLNFYKHVCSSNNSCISADLGSVDVREVGISFPLCWLACFPNTCFTSPFASRVPTAPIPVSLWLGSSVVGLKYWRISVLILKKKNPASEEQWNLFCHLHCSYPTQGQKHPLPLPLLEQPDKVHWFDSNVSINHTYQEPPTSLIMAILSLRCRQHSQNSQSKVHAKHYSITVCHMLAHCSILS